MCSKNLAEPNRSRFVHLLNSLSVPTPPFPTSPTTPWSATPGLTHDALPRRRHPPCQRRLHRRAQRGWTRSSPTKATFAAVLDEDGLTLRLHVPACTLPPCPALRLRTPTHAPPLCSALCSTSCPGGCANELLNGEGHRGATTVAA
jgi:hypothetical protein